MCEGIILSILLTYQDNLRVYFSDLEAARFQYLLGELFTPVNRSIIVYMPRNFYGNSPIQGFLLLLKGVSLAHIFRHRSEIRMYHEFFAGSENRRIIGGYFYFGSHNRR